MLYLDCEETTSVINNPRFLAPGPPKRIPRRFYLCWCVPLDGALNYLPHCHVSETVPCEALLTARSTSLSRIHDVFLRKHLYSCTRFGTGILRFLTNGLFAVYLAIHQGRPAATESRHSAYNRTQAVDGTCAGISFSLGRCLEKVVFQSTHRAEHQARICDWGGGSRQ